MPRRKARPEAAAAMSSVSRNHMPPSRHEFTQPAMLAQLAEATEQPKHPNPVPGDDGEALSRIAASFRARFPDEWAEWAKCPLEAGLVAMAAKMKGKG